jgi:O-acetyl-ADP-ribose deacetylase (regulator of RNase III)
MIEIRNIVGDATNPEGEGMKVITHVCNNGGGWGHGFVMALSKKWKQPEQAYRIWSQDPVHFQLGQVQMVPVETNIVVANMIGQVVGYENGMPPIRYEAIRRGLQAIRNYCKKHNASLHCPQFGSGLAGGSWEIIEQIIKEELSEYDIPVTVYEFADTKSPFYIPVKA